MLKRKKELASEAVIEEYVLTPSSRTLDPNKLRKLIASTNNWDAENELGGGATATVYKGQLNAHETVAIKRFHESVDLSWVKREAAILSRCRHPHIVHIHALCEPERALVLEFMDRGSLHDLLTNKDGKDAKAAEPWQTQLRILCNIAVGLRHLHDRSPAILHRDIKPANILLTSPSYLAKIGDVGLAKQIRLGESGVDAGASGAGTDQYMDPDLKKGGRFRSHHDVYSFGITMMQVVCSRKWVDPYMLQDVSDFNRGDMDFQTLIARQQDWVALTPRNQWKEPAGKLVLSLAARCTDRLLEAR
eukprot:jgi/Tetstr1/440794/TSEL_029101.t1